MSHQKSFILLSSCLLLSSFCGSRADTTVIETTVQRSSSLADSGVFVLPSTGNYVVVDPISGLPRGRYDPISGLVDGRALQSGLAIIDSPTGNLVAIVDPSGRVVDVAVAPVSDVLMVSIDTRRRDLDQQIAQALSRGQITATEASALRAELERINSDELAFRGSSGTLTYRRAFVAASSLNVLAQRLYPRAVLTPVISPQFTVIDKQLTLVDQVTYRKLQLQRRIDDEYQAGRLSANHVSHLKAQMDKISVFEARSRRNGALSVSKTRTLSMKLDQLESSMGRDVAYINDKRARIGIRVN